MACRSECAQGSPT